MSRDKRAKFVELAQNRVNKAISHIRLVGNLANRANYEFDDEDAKKIIRALQKELDALKGKFNETSSAQGSEFKL
jgi:ABC-type Fe3+-hydroxamate transport system substrate-binding protein